MLDYGVEVKPFQNFNRVIGSPTVKVTGDAKPVPQTKAEVQTVTTQDGVTLTAPPPSIPSSETMTVGNSPVRFKQSDGPYALKPKEVTLFQNGPLTEGITLYPAYREELSPLESRYPGVAHKLSSFEVEAAMKGYCPVGTKHVEQAVIESPPWPQTDYGNARTNISAKAKEIQQSHPELNTSDPGAYDFKKANRDAGKLMEELHDMFPKDKFPGIVMGARAKAPASLAKKMEKQTAADPSFTLAHLTDTVGARIDSPDLKTLGEVAKALEKKYEGKIVAKSDYVTNPGANGYRALHYTVDIDGRMTEIQASTTSLRTADLATHDTVYKQEFPVSPEAAQELAGAADRIMFLECLKLKE